MARYIDADKAVEDARLSYCKDCNSYNGIRCRSCGFDDAMDYIEDAPTADVVEVVRCKDCVYWESVCGRTTGKCESPRNGLFYEYTDNLDFCSYGERQ